ncbi:peptide ABC transporter substrate-binding protein [Lactobacillus kitasatonis]|uniref:Oligopeptide ABC superfamily ATP binding cassette transporter substrate binding protein n=1 Tax=Lactobacillus kitasatonis DSM 16761 = JCM 1039 TaxID=1423767 RepID=A0A0R1VWP8_9LACO|nr:peptide ABC transporter substrate-binding protein [Lactobacillus kitasatonis]KRM07206.1 oligopeptide ABC superfamily ATP binding cassette transporter substrate binding protein [Lactobacillus kitasatonis DSM 16761 = JCM 1039]
MKISKKILATGTIIVSALALAACGNQSASQKKKQVLNWSETTQLSTQDPSLATDTTSFQALLNTGDGLYRLDKNNKPKLSLAKSVKISKGGRVYDFVLRKNSKWSNGDPLTAKDFVYSYQRTVNPATKSQMAFYLYQIKNAQAINSGKKQPSTLGVTAPSKYHLRIELTRPLSYFKNLLAWPLFFPQNQKVVQKYGKLYGTQAKYTVSSGPFILTKWTGNNKTWTLVKNKNYWDTKDVKLSKVNEQVSESTTTSYNLFQAGKADETGLTGQQVASNKNKSGYHARLSSAIRRLELNQNKVKAFKNLKIRQAFSYAINRQQLANNILKDGSIPAKGFVPSGMGTNPKTGAQFEDDAYVKSDVSYDLQKAKSLLKQGYKETGTKSINVTLLASDDDTSKQTAEFLQSQLDRLPNVNISVQSIPFTQLISRQTAGNYEITLKNWQAVFGDPINFLDVFQKGSSYLNNGWNNNQFNKLLDQSENVYGNNPVKRWSRLVAAEKILMKDQGTIPLVQVAHPQLLKTDVKNVSFNPTGVPYDFKNVYLG